MVNTLNVDELHLYTLHVEYKEMNVDQSEDMGKQLSAKIDIHAENEAVTIKGTVSNYSTGEYVQINSVKKTSQIKSDGSYVLAGVEIGSHTLKIMNADGTVKASKAITIIKGKTSGVNNSTVTVTDSSEEITISIDSSTKLFNIGETVKENVLGAGTLAGKIIENAKNETNGTTYNKLLTTPAQEISLPTEKTLGIATDDLGTSYYFRGSVTNNYVNFANMCWRIVRIQGDGSIKLILEDRRATCDSENYTGDWTPISEHSSAEYDEYGNYFLNNYEKMLMKKNYVNYLKNNMFRKDTREQDYEILYDKNGNVISEKPKYADYGFYDEIKNKYEELSHFYFDTGRRLEGIGIDAYATLKNSSGNSYVGIISADEVAFAGGKANESNTNYYLINNFQQIENIAFNTNSFSTYDLSGEPYAFGYDIDENGKIINDWTTYTRLTVGLLEGTKYIKGNGLRTNPYIVE